MGFTRQIETGRSERLATTLSYIRRGEPDLTQRQIAILMLVCWTAGPHKVGVLAKTIGIHKPVVSRAIRSLRNLGLVDFYRDDDTDKRLVYVVATPASHQFLERMESTSA